MAVIAEQSEREVDVPASPEPEKVLRERASRFKGHYEELNRRWELVANLRLYSFLAAVACVGLGLWQGWSPLVAFGGAILLVFAGLIWLHRRVGRERKRFLELYLINDEAFRRIHREWDALPMRGETSLRQLDPSLLEPYAGDLDIFGRASLFRLLDTAGTFMGERKLARWLLSPATPAEVRARQEAARELAPLVDFRDELHLRGRLIGQERADPEPFLAWAEADPWLARRSWVRVFAYASLAAFWGLALAHAFGLINYPWWFVVGIVNAGFTLWVGRSIHDQIEQAASGERGFQHYAGAFELFSGQDFQSPELKRLQSSLSSGESHAHEALGRLRRILSFTLPETTIMYLIVESATLWEVHHLGVLERWKRRRGSHARGWLETLGEAEALGALAALSFSQPGWAFPEVDSAVRCFEAEGLGHPFLPDNVRVHNDIVVGPPGTFLLVTGSNMSGKSTLLRAIGVNAVLAQAGGPVCASSLAMPPADLWTSMRVEDSLERGVSYFMAELQRLKRVVDAAREEPGEDGRRLLYLLDEILQGTNTQERQVAARRVIKHLVAQGALGAVSTHDLTLADAPDVAEIAHLVHFTETIDGGASGPEMSFDYKLRPGLATSTNALKLMEIVGLELE